MGMPDMPPCTVLLTAAGGAGIPGIMRCLRYNGERQMRLVATDMAAATAALHLADAAYQVPPAHAPGYADAVLEIVARERVEVVFVNIGFEMLPLARRRAEFAQVGAHLRLPAAETVALLNNKHALYEAVRQHGLGVPRTIRVERANMCEPAITALGYPQTPVCFKPEEGSGGRGFRVVLQEADFWNTLMASKDQAPYIDLDVLRAAWSTMDALPPLLFMEYLPGEEYSIDCLAEHGQARYIIPRLRDQVSLGASVAGTVVRSEEAILYTRRLIEHLGLHGNLNVQLKRASDGALKLVEVNPRLSGTVVLCYAAGVNLPYFGVKQALGEALPAVEPRWGTRLLRHWAEVFIAPDGIPFWV